MERTILLTCLCIYFYVFWVHAEVSETSEAKVLQNFAIAGSLNERQIRENKQKNKPQKNKGNGKKGNGKGRKNKGKGKKKGQGRAVKRKNKGNGKKKGQGRVGKRKNKGNGKKKGQGRAAKRKNKGKGKKKGQGRAGKSNDNDGIKKGKGSKVKGNGGKGKGKGRKNKGTGKKKGQGRAGKRKNKGKGKKKGQGRAGKGNDKIKKGKGSKVKGNGGKVKGKGRKNKGKGKKKGQGRAGKSSGCSRQTDSGVNSTCLEAAVFYMNIISTVIANFDKQKGRMVKQNKTGASKSGKKGLFKPLVDRLVLAGGGNKSAMTCSGKSGTPGASQLTNLTTKFEECESKINESCNPANFPQPNKARLDACATITKTFADTVKSCTNKKGAEACTCWLDTTLNTTSKTVKKCTFKTESDAIAKQLKACKKAFSVCRKYEDDTIKSLSACSKDESKLKERGAQLTKNTDAITKAQTKVDALVGSRSGRQMTKRANAASCSDVIKKVTFVITLTGQNPASAKILEISLEISSAGDITCSDDDKKGLKEKQASLKSAVAEITAATALVLAEVLELTGVALSLTDLAAFVAPTTKPTGDSATTKPTGDSATTKPTGDSATTKPTGASESTKPSTGGSPGVTSGGIQPVSMTGAGGATTAGGGAAGTSAGGSAAGTTAGDSACINGIQTYPSSMPNSDYYTRLCTTSNGLRIVSAAKAQDSALVKTAIIISSVMSKVDPRVAQSMNDNNFRHAVMAAYPSELTTDIPEHAWLGSEWNERARGLGATVSVPVGSSAEENVLCYPDDRYRGEDITIHEFAHSVHLLGFTFVFSSFTKDLMNLYADAKEGNLWASEHYAMTNYIEYFAEGVQSYFDANYQVSQSPTNREQLKSQDPKLFDFLDKYFGYAQWRSLGC